jgi:hypothetical protein
MVQGIFFKPWQVGQSTYPSPPHFRQLVALQRWLDDAEARRAIVEAALTARDESGGTPAQRAWQERLTADGGGTVAVIEWLSAANAERSNAERVAGRRDPGRDYRMLALGLLGGMLIPSRDEEAAFVLPKS